MNNCPIGIDLGGTKLLLLCGDIEEVCVTGISFTPDELLLQLEFFITRHALTPTCIGLAVPGLVENDGCIAACDVLPAFKGWQARYALQKFCASVAVLNDVKAAMLEEMQDVPENTTGGVIMVGTAIGAAFMVHGQPLLGASGWAGELGYLPIQCRDAQVKRLDEVAGGAAIARRCGVMPAMLAQRAKAGDPAILHAIEQAGEAFGLGIATVINLLNPSVLSVGGGTSQLPGYWEAALATAKQHALPELWRDCSLIRVKAGSRVVAFGAIRAADRGCKTNCVIA